MIKNASSSSTFGRGLERGKISPLFNSPSQREGEGFLLFQLCKENSTETISLQLLKEIIKSSGINPILKNHFLNELKVVENQIKKGKNKNAAKILEILEKQIEIFSDKKMFNKLRIDKDEAESLIKIIETIRLNLTK